MMCIVGLAFALQSAEGAQPAAARQTYTTYLPIVTKNTRAWLKGSAGAADPTMPGIILDAHAQMGIEWAYSWNGIYTPTNLAWELVNDIRARSGSLDWAVFWGPCALPTQQAIKQCASAIARQRHGQYWLIFNEPEIFDQDNLTPTLGAIFFKDAADLLQGADPSAQLIVGNVIFPDWLSSFLSEYRRLYGSDARTRIAGYGFHLYSVIGADCGSWLDSASDACLLANWQRQLAADLNWVRAHDAGKEVWITEANWHFDEPAQDWGTETRRMGQICGALRASALAGQINRFAWFYGLWPYSQRTITTSLLLQSGTPSPAGLAYRDC